MSNANNNIDVSSLSLSLIGSTIVGVLNPSNYATHQSGTLQIVTATETAPGVVSWGSPTTITGSPFFGTNAGSTLTGDFTAAAPILLPNGKWMQLLYGYQAGDPSPAWCDLLDHASDGIELGQLHHHRQRRRVHAGAGVSEANAFIDASNNIVLIVRQDATSLALQTTNYWRIVCPAGSDPTVAANWNAPTFVAFDGNVGKPDVLGLANNGMFLMTRGGIGTNALIGYNVNWNAGKSPFSGNRASLLNPTFNDRQYWYSQSQLLNANEIGTVLAADAPVGIYLITSPFAGVGQSQ